MLLGMAKPIPSEPPVREKMAVLMPISSPLHIDQGAAGISGIDRGIGLNEIFIVCNADIPPTQGADYAERHG